jgi:hypothetical protein
VGVSTSPAAEAFELRRVRPASTGHVRGACPCGTLLAAVEQQTYLSPTKASAKEYLAKDWLPAVEATIRPSTYNSNVQHVDCPGGGVALGFGNAYEQRCFPIDKLLSTGDRVLAKQYRRGSRMAEGGRFLSGARGLARAAKAAVDQAGIHPEGGLGTARHATVSITLDTYCHAVRAVQEEAAALIAGLVFAAE